MQEKKKSPFVTKLMFFFLFFRVALRHPRTRVREGGQYHQPHLRHQPGQHGRCVRHYTLFPLTQQENHPVPARYHLFMSSAFSYVSSVTAFARMSTLTRTCTLLFGSTLFFFSLACHLLQHFIHDIPRNSPLHQKELTFPSFHISHELLVAEGMWIICGMAN